MTKEMTKMPKSRRPTRIKYKSLRIFRRVFKLPRPSWQIINDYAIENRVSVGFVVIQLTAQIRKESNMMAKLKYNSHAYGVAEIQGVVALLRVWSVNRIMEKFNESD